MLVMGDTRRMTDKTPMDTTSRRLETVRAEIRTAAIEFGRDPLSVTLVAVSKTHGVDQVLEAIHAGQRLFGENRVQEAKEKWPALKSEFPDVELHLLGPLQTNKVKDAVALFDVIQSVDRDRLAVALAAEMAKTGRRPRCLIEVNVGEEPQKAGIPPLEVEGFVRRCRDDLGLPITGLMCVPPVDEEPAPHFALLAQTARRLGLSDISMGMSADFPIAIQFGATMVRVGTAIFGSRPPLQQG